MKSTSISVSRANLGIETLVLGWVISWNISPGMGINSNIVDFGKVAPSLRGSKLITEHLRIGPDID